METNEKKEIHVLNVYQTYRLYLWTPWDPRFEKWQHTLLGRELEKISKEEFIQHCYSTPVKDVNSQISPRDKFCELLNSILDRPIILMGFGGIGKTTFLYSTLTTLDPVVPYTVFDVIRESQLTEPYEMQDWIDIKFSDKPLTKQLTTLLLNRIYETLGINDNNSFKGMEFLSVSGE